MNYKADFIEEGNDLLKKRNSISDTIFLLNKITRGERLLRFEVVGRIVELVERHAVRAGGGEVGVDDEIDAFGAQVGGRDCAPFPVEEFLVLHRCEERGMPGRRLGVGAPYEGHGT